MVSSSFGITVVQVLTVLRFVLCVLLLILAVISSLKESVVLYKATKQWQPNRYIQLLVKDGILYFLVYVFLFPFIQFHSLPSHFSHHLTRKYVQKN